MERRGDQSQSNNVHRLALAVLTDPSPTDHFFPRCQLDAIWEGIFASITSSMRLK